MAIARTSGWTIAGIAVAALIVAPLLVLPASFFEQGEALDQIAADLLPEALHASLVLAAGVGAGTLVLGGALAALVSFYDFPGRRWLDWGLVLPLAMPAYVLVFVLPVQGVPVGEVGVSLVEDERGGVEKVGDQLDFVFGQNRPGRGVRVRHEAEVRPVGPLRTRNRPVVLEQHRLEARPLNLGE